MQLNKNGKCGNNLQQYHHHSNTRINMIKLANREFGQKNKMANWSTMMELAKRNFNVFEWLGPKSTNQDPVILPQNSFPPFLKIVLVSVKLSFGKNLSVFVKFYLFFESI